MKTNFLSILWISTIGILFFTACKKDETTPDLSETLYGPEVEIGNGTIRSFIEKDATGTPTVLGLEFPASALENLPQGAEHGESFILELPETLAPYDHISFDWNEHGHGPQGIYDIPHFDVHFYFMSFEDRMQIGPFDTLQFANKPDPKYLPDNHIWTDGVPTMGAHWIDPTSPELNGAPFTKTFIFGSYDGEVTFIEPMISLDYLKGKPGEATTPIPQPTEWQKAGYYPMTYSIRYDAAKGRYSITLDQLRKE